VKACATARDDRQRVAQCEALGEYAIAEYIRGILVDEQDHQIALATALGIAIPNAAKPEVQPASVRQMKMEANGVG